MNIRDMKNYERINNPGTGGMIMLKDNLRQILNCEAMLVTNPIEYFDANFGIDIKLQPNRSVYRTAEQVLLSCKVMENNIIQCYLGIRLFGNLILMYDNGFFEDVANTITRVLSDCYVQSKFRDSMYWFNEFFTYRLIYNVLCKGYYLDTSVDYLIKLIRSLSNMTFENEHFSTGFILTKEVSRYNDGQTVDRKGEIIELDEIINVKLTDRYNKRAWNIVDGVNNFFLFDKKFETRRIFLRNNSGSNDSNFIDSISMAESIYGHDIAFRTFGHNQFSIINSDKVEFVNIENKWKIRSYDIIKKFLTDKLCYMKVDNVGDIVNRIFYFAYYCSTENRSSIIWIPNDMSNIDEYLISGKNSFMKTSLSIIDNKYQSIILRCITSDGVSIIDDKGELFRFGQIVDLSDAKINGLTGTGETATKLLSNNGIAIKISADGTIKMYFNPADAPIQI